MTQQPYDQLSKQLLEELLTPLGTVQRSLEIPGEAKWVDLWYVPNAEQVKQGATDLFEKIAQKACLLEPYRNPPSWFEVRSCMLKALWVQEDLRRKATQQGQSLSEQDVPLLWIIATTISKPVLQAFGTQTDPGWGNGIYFAAAGWKVALISIKELPRSRETLVLRLLGRGEVQRQAIADVLELSAADPKRLQMLRILGNWKVALELDQIEFDDQQSIMALSQAFLEWEQATEQKGIQKGLEQGLEQGERMLMIRLLTKKLGMVPSAAVARIESLSIEQISALAEALFEFKTYDDLQDWLEQH